MDGYRQTNRQTDRYQINAADNYTLIDNTINKQFETQMDKYIDDKIDRQKDII